MNDVASSGPQPLNGKEPASPQTGPGKTAAPDSKPASGPAPVSRAPLNLGAASPPAAAPATVAPTAARPTAAPAAPAAAPRPVAPKPVPMRPAAPANGAVDRVTGCKTFFTKLHPGAIDFLDEQISQWLKDNPTVVIKMTNTTVGEVQGKKNEPNILMTVWYHGTAAKTMSHMG